MFTHASWSERRSDSYARLAFLGDSVLGAGDHHPPVSAPGGRALRRGPADEDPRADGLGRLLPRGRRAARRARAPAGRGARRASGSRGRAGRDRARARLGDRGGDRRLLPARRLRAHRRGGRRGVPARRSSRRWSTRSTSSRRCRSGSPSAATIVDYEVTAELGPAARPHVRGRRDGRRTQVVGAGAGAPRRHAEQEAARGPSSRCEDVDEEDVADAPEVDHA